MKESTDMLFYYDESQHSRVINEKYLKEQGKGYDTYIGCFIGVPVVKTEAFESAYVEFEKKWKKFYALNDEQELKGELFRGKQFKYGLKGLNKDSARFYIEFLQVLNKCNLTIQITMLSKISYAVMQLVHCLFPYQPIFSMQGAIYTLSKFILIYQPENVWEALLMETTTLDLREEIKKFLSDKIECYKSVKLKEQERNAFITLLEFLNKSWRDRIVINKAWDYSRISECLKAFIKNTEVSLNPELYIDDGNKVLNTILIADGFTSQEADSKKYAGIRACDIISNLTGRLLVAMDDSFTYKSEDDYMNYKKLNKEFFDLNENTFEIYRLLFKLIINDSSYYTVCSDFYFDNTVKIVTILYYFNQYADFSEYKKDSIETHQEKYNSMLVNRIQEEFKRTGIS